MISFGPLYKSIMQVSMIFGSNFKKKRRLAFLMLAFLLVEHLLLYIKSQKQILFI